MQTYNLVTKICVLVLTTFSTACSNADEFASRKVMEYCRACDKGLQANIPSTRSGDLELAAYNKDF